MAKKRLFVLVSIVVTLLIHGTTMASEADLRRELELLKRRVAELEAKLEQAEGAAAKTFEAAKARRGEKASDAAKLSEEESEHEELKPKIADIKEELKEKFGSLEIHGGAVAFYQGATSAVIEGEGVEGASGAGVVADLELTFKPGLPVFDNGFFFIRAHAGEGKGADRDLEDRLFANVNTIAGDSPDDQNDAAFRLLEAYYAHQFFGEKLTFVIGKTDPLAFIDTNEFANDEYSQFIGKPFVNSPMLDSEDEYAPIAVLSIAALEGLSFTALVSSSSRPNALEDRQKSVYDEILDQPFLAAQVTYSPNILGRDGNYRLYVWDATYKHVSVRNQQLGVDEDSRQDGWGIGVSLDQKVTERLGLFGRFSYQNEDIYPVGWFWSLGASLKGIIPSRDEDRVGIGFAGLHTSDELDYGGVELHLETYYRIFLSDNFAITPDLQYVVNPLGRSSNDDVLVGAVRGEFSF